MHKSVSELIGEAEDIAREISVVEEHRKSLLESLEAVFSDYKGKKLRYSEYQQKTNSILKDKSKEEWLGYFGTYIYSLLKKIEFIIEQAAKIVSDDDSFAKLGVSAVKPMQFHVPQKKKAEPFNIDNEISRLRDLLNKKITNPKVSAEEIKKISVKVPDLAEIREDISKAEEAAKARAAELARAKQEQLAKEASLRKAEKQVKVQKPAAAKARKFSLPKIHLRIPRFHFGIPKLNFSPSEGMAELRAARAALKSLFSRSKQPKPILAASKSTGPLISFSDKLEENLNLKKEAPKPKKPEGEKKGFFSNFSLKAKSKKIFVEDIVSMEKTTRKDISMDKIASGGAGIAFGWFSPKRMLYEFTKSHFKEKQEPILGKETAVPLHMRKLREMRKKLYQEERLSGFDSTLLAQEAKRIKRILEVEKHEVYQGSSLGLIANVTVRKISLFLVNNFPQFFGYLYNALRAANVKVLSNTYVNIMVLVSLASVIATFFLLLVVFFILGHPILQVFLRSVIFSVTAGFLSATIFYVYPFMKIRDRRRKTTTNLPFAINHMSAVATSGVPPARMFELIAESEEYEEVGVEVKKIVDFTNIFGYDLLTAIRAVAGTTPSIPFKKFLEGLISTIETGGDLVEYLSQQADEAALTYKLERQRYNETVSTYSDIYTGVLIAAPLFFIAAMALVNMLGGSLGGLGVGLVMALGAYVVIPLLNIGFILFLQATQPEV